MSNDWSWSARYSVSLPLYAVLAQAFRRWERSPVKCLIRMDEDLCVLWSET